MIAHTLYFRLNKPLHLLSKSLNAAKTRFAQGVVRPFQRKIFMMEALYQKPMNMSNFMNVLRSGCGFSFEFPFL
jgi:hypothetical protein